MIKPRLPAAVLAISVSFGVGAPANANSCKADDDACLPIMGCVVETKEAFHGTAKGKRGGPLVVAGQGGISCTGTWNRSLLSGNAQFTCSDGRSGSVDIDNIHIRSGTVSGSALLNSGQTVEIFVGPKIAVFFQANAKLNGKRPACATVLPTGS